jgi:hypothetical protein
LARAAGSGDFRNYAFFPNALTDRRRSLLLLLALGLILAGNFVTRRWLERWEHVPYFELAGTTNARILANGWRVLLPINTSEDQYCWCTTGSVVIVVLESFLTERTIFCLLNALLIVTTFWTSWAALRDTTFTLTMTLCMGFGTQFHYAYVLTCIYAFYLFLAYIEVNLLCIYKLVVARDTRLRWYVGYLASLVVMVLCHETWLNYYVFLCTSAAFLYLFARRHACLGTRQMLLVIATTTLLAAVYIPIKVHYGRQHFRPGAEDEIILGYPYWSLAVDDFLSNLITYVYMSFTNYLPPPLFNSASDYFLTGDIIRGEQYGYHPEGMHLIETHHLFFWRYQAGAIFLAFLYLLGTSLVRALRDGSREWASVAVLLLLVATGSATHVMIKHRSYLSAATLSYKCLISIFGATLLMAYGLMLARRLFSRPWLYRCLLLLSWGVILLAAALRPAYHSHLHTKVGLRIYPDPVQKLRRLWHR